MNIRGLSLLVVLVSVLAAASCSDWPGSIDGGAPASSSQLEDVSGLLGSSCGSSVSCLGGLTCVTVAPAGLCTKPCASDADCQQVGSCQWVPDWGGQICLKRCTSDVSCRPEYSCQVTVSGSVCFEAPVTSGDAG